MTFSGDMSSLNTIYTSAVNNYSKFVKKIYLYLAATPITFSGDKSPLIAIFCGDYFVVAKEFRHKTLAVTFQRRLNTFSGDF